MEQTHSLSRKVILNPVALQSQTKLIDFDQTQLAPNIFSALKELGAALVKPILFTLPVLLLGVYILNQNPQYDNTLAIADNTEITPSLFGRLEKLTYKPKKLNILSPAELEDLKGQVKFIAGLIAMHRPSIKDCGLVAKEIVEISNQKNIDPFLVAAIISVESRFEENALSQYGASGLMQIMPATAKGIPGARARANQLSNAKNNIELGVEYIQYLQKKYRGNPTLALAAYNWGPGKVDRSRTNMKPMPTSVQKYASKILERHANWAKHFKQANRGASMVVNS
jgi:hypothetical protein